MYAVLHRFLSQRPEGSNKVLLYLLQVWGVPIWLQQTPGTVEHSMLTP